MQEYTGENFIMDTLIRISVYSLDEKLGQNALEQAFSEFARINTLTDKFAPQNLPDPEASDVYRINENAGVKPVPVSDDTMAMLEESRYFSQLSDGAFDVSIGPLVDLWGFGKEKYHLPLEKELEEKLALVGYHRILLNKEKKTVFLPKEGMKIDLGGIAKGYATDRAVQKLREMGIKHAMINAGGNVYGLGPKPDGSPWRVGIQDPRDKNQIISILSIQDMAVVTSGDYERYFIQDGTRYHHILDPANGKPAREIMTTTIVSPSATNADIYSTALFILGSDRGAALSKKHRDIGTVFVDVKGNITFSNKLKDQIEFIDGGDYKVKGSF